MGYSLTLKRGTATKAPVQYMSPRREVRESGIPHVLACKPKAEHGVA